MMPRRWAEAAVVLLVAGVSLVAVRVVRTAPAHGLLVDHWTNTEFDGAPAGRLEPEPPDQDTVARLTRTVRGPVAIEWRGTLFIADPGAYRLELVSDDGAWLFLDEELLIDNGGMHGVLRAEAAVTLERGAHSFRLRYMDGGGDAYLGLRWSPPGAAAFEAISPHAFASDDAAANRLRVVGFLRHWLPPLWALLLLYLPARLGAAWLRRQVLSTGASKSDRNWLTVTLIAGLALLLWGIEWNLGRALDEMVPTDVIDAMTQRFSNGWHLHYPMLHVAVDAIPMAGFMLADYLGVSPVTSPSNVAFVMLAFRVVSVLMAMGVLVLSYLCASELVGPRAARFAPAGVLLSPVFLFYGKMANVDVPYLFWFAVALLGFIRVLKHHRRGDYFLLALGAAAAVATKDMAYGLVALLPVGVVAVHARDASGRWSWRGLAEALGDRRLWMAGFTSVVLFGVFSNIFLNWSGFVGHLGDLAASRFEGFFRPGLAGQVDLLWSTTELLVFGLGAPLLILAAAGVAMVAKTRDSRWALWALLPIASKYLTFNTVVPYNFDRFLVGEFFVLALFAAAASDWLVHRRRRIVGTVCVAIVYGWSFLYATSINVALERDARRVAAAWLSEQVGPGERVGYLGATSYLPSPDGFRTVLLLPEAGISASTPEWIVTNREFNHRYAARPDQARVIDGLYNGDLGYVEMARFTTALPPWAPLRYAGPFRDPGEYQFSNLDKVMADISVFRRAPGR